jgi:hypothetical protein
VGDWISIPEKGRDFTLCHHIQTSSGSLSVSYQMGTEGFLTRDKADHSPPFSVEVKNAWSYISTPPYVFMVWCLIKHQGQPYLLHIELVSSLLPIKHQ